mmetsp:Transcript_88477/g.211235  ORF Transcript_88477/g.211235 Transcript_88477/m.211235 type:complete len:81 (+) Transcript_88477:1602-1844(+)
MRKYVFLQDSMPGMPMHSLEELWVEHAIDTLGFAVLLSCLYSAEVRQRPKCREHFGVWGSTLAAKVAQDVVDLHQFYGKR